KAQAQAAWPALAQAAGLPACGQAMDILLLQTNPRDPRAVLSIRGPGHGGLVLKHGPGETEGWFDSQVAAYRRAEAAFAGACDLGVSRLVAADRARRALLMELVPGQTVQAAMERADGARRLEILGACGRWMGHLHRSGGTKPGRHQPDQLLARIGQWERRIADGRLDVPDRGGFLDLAARTRAWADATRTVETTRVAVHGDMGLHNIMVDGDRIYGIDFGTLEYRPPATDIARLLTWHETYFGPVDGDPVDAPDAARAAVLDGHGGAWTAPSELDYLMAGELLRLWRSVPASRLRRGWFHRRRWKGVRRMVERLRV
ncbi:MAG: aminoglycoside phosphotransferase family protein, partial [Pseudomonadota bacterium]